MWKVVITEIQDASALDPINAPPGAFFVSTERFARTVEKLDLSKLINAIDGMQSLPGGKWRESTIPSERAPRRDINRLAGIGYLETCAAGATLQDR